MTIRRAITVLLLIDAARQLLRAGYRRGVLDAVATLTATDQETPA